MSEYKLRKVKLHIFGAGMNSPAHMQNAAYFLLECGHVVSVSNVNWKSKHRRCKTCVSGEFEYVAPMIMSCLDRSINSGATGLTWDDVHPFYRAN